MTADGMASPDALL